MLTFNEVVEQLKDADVTATDLDFIVCNCGAYIMYADMDGNWRADEAWEAKAMYRWDKKLVVRRAPLRVLGPCVSGDPAFSVTLHLP